MASTVDKPVFKVAPEKPPLKLPPDAAIEAAPPPSEWQPIDTAPTDPDAKFLVRTSIGSEPVKGTETVVRYRATRKRIGGRWAPSLTIIDDRLETKLGFRLTEWKPL